MVEAICLIKKKIIQMTNLKLTDREWREFRIGDIFVVSRGKRLIEKDRKKGEIPYYSASSVNNGVTDYISNPLFTAENKLFVTTFCDCYFADRIFTASDEITILDNEKLNKYSGKFISTIVMSNKNKYAFGRKAFTDRIREQKILLPVKMTSIFTPPPARLAVYGALYQAKRTTKNTRAYGTVK